MHDVGVVTVDVVMMMVVSFRTVGVGMIVGVIVTMVCRGVSRYGCARENAHGHGSGFCAVAVL